MSQAPEVVKISELIAPVYYEEYRAVKNNEFTYYWNQGGRSSAKSSFVSVAIAMGLKRDATAHAAILMKVGDKIEEKVVQQMQWALQVLRLDHEWKFTKKPNKAINIYTKQTIVFSGCDDPMKTKGIKAPFGAFKFIWFEETDQFKSWKEIRTVLQTLFRTSNGEKVNFSVFLSYNPPREPNNWVNKCSVEKWPNRYVLKTTYLDVPVGWLTKEFLEEAERLKRVDERAYRHEFLGEAVGRDGLVYPMFDPDKHVISKLEANEAITMVVCGIDGGAIIDATTCVPLCLTTHGRIVCLPTMYYSPVELGHRPLATQDQATLIYKHLALLWQALGYRPNDIELVVDSAASDIFLELFNYGEYTTMKVDKKDVMVDMRRVQALLSYEGAFAILNQGYSSPLTGDKLGPNDMLIEELQSKVVDEKTGKPEDGNDHDIDALKYATRRLQLKGVI